jgi:hypothetical protein
MSPLIGEVVDLVTGPRRRNGCAVAESYYAARSAREPEWYEESERMSGWLSWCAW